MVPQPKSTYPYRTIGCVFNHKTFLANCQPSDAVELCVFDFADGSRWKAMSEEAIRSVCVPGSTSSLPPTPPLCSPSVLPSEASNQLELEMRYLLAEHRKVTHMDKKPFSTIYYYVFNIHNMLKNDHLKTPLVC